MGDQKRMKEGVVPNIFHYQLNRKRTQPPRVVDLKSIKRHLLLEALASCSTTPEHPQNESTFLPNKTKD